MAFATREQAATAYQNAHGKPLPPFDPERPYQPFMETRPKPGDSDEAGYEYNFIAPDSSGYWRMETAGVPWIEAIVPNMPGPNDPPVKPGSVYNIPLRELTVASDAPNSLEVLGSSPFGPEITTTALLEYHGLLSVPPDVLAEIQAGKYVPPGVA